MRFAYVAGNQSHGGQCPYGLHTLIELANAHAPVYACALWGSGIHTGGLADGFGINARDFRNRFRRIVVHNGFKFCKASRVLFYELLVRESLVNNDVHQSIDEGHVGTVFQGNMQVGDARSFNLARITDNDGCPFFFRLYHPAGDNGVRICRIPPKDEQAFSIFNLHNGVAHCAIADRLLQTCN